MEIPLYEDGRLEPGEPRVVMRTPPLTTLEPHPDGERFLIVRELETDTEGDVLIRLGWFTELEGRAPTGK